MNTIDLKNLPLTDREFARATGCDAPHLLAEAAQILWEDVIECESSAVNGTRDNDEHVKLVAQIREQLGSIEMRYACRNLAHAMVIAHAIMPDEAQEAMSPYDWEFGPWFMRECVDWQGVPTYGVTLRKDWVQIVRAKVVELEKQQAIPPQPKDEPRLWLATVRLVVEASGESEACDALGSLLTDRLESEGAIVDWGYLPLPNGRYADPVEVRYPDPMPEGPVGVSDLVFVKGEK